MLVMDGSTWAIILSELRTCPIRKDAISKAGVTPDDVRKHLQAHPDAQREFLAAFDEGIDSLEDEAIRRALHGVEEPVFGRDGLIGYKTVYANDLTKLVLTAYRRRYRGESSEGGSISEEARAALQKVFGSWVTPTAKDTDDESEDTPTERPAAKPQRKAGKERKSARSKFL